MKKIIALTIISILVFATFTGCKIKSVKTDTPAESKIESTIESLPESTTESDVESTPESTPESKPESTPESKPESKPENKPDNKTDNKTESKNETTQVKPVLEFTNLTNNAYDINAVSIKPRHVYWENGKLIAECFVINGFSNNVSNIIVDNLTFANKDGVFASASFGTINRPALPPYSHFVWTFLFESDTLSKTNVDISFLNCTYDVRHFNS